MKRLLALGAALFALGASADEAQVRRALEARFGGMKIEGVQPTPVPGLYEVRVSGREGPQILYSDAQGNHVLDGSLYDARSGRNLTEERLRRLTAIEFDALPLALAVKVQRGSGRRVMAIFSDPYCPACQRFEKELVQVEDVTVYYFMYPVIRPELASHSKSVWCSADRGKAWLDLALRGKPPSASPACDTPIDKVLELGKQLGVNSTPTLILANGERVRGGMPAEQLRAALDGASRKK